MKSPLILLLAISTGTASLGITCTRNEHLRAAYLKSLAHRDGKVHTKAAIRRWALDREKTLARFEFACSQEIDAVANNPGLPLLDDGLKLEGVDGPAYIPSSFVMPTEDATLLAVLETEPLPSWTGESKYAAVEGNGGFYGGGYYGGGGFFPGLPGGLVGGGGNSPTPPVIPIAPPSPVPEPGSLMLLLSGLLIGTVKLRRTICPA